MAENQAVKDSLELVHNYLNEKKEAELSCNHINEQKEVQNSWTQIQLNPEPNFYEQLPDAERQVNLIVKGMYLEKIGQYAEYSV